MSWAEDDFQSEKMDRSRHRKSREGIASVPEAATPPRKKSRPPAGGLRLERERERERDTPRQGRKNAICWPLGGAGWGVLGQKVFFTTILGHKPLFGWKFWVPRGRAEPPPFLLAKLMKRLP